MKNIQKIKTNLSKIPCPFGTRPHADRIETGALQINDDWPGVFLRGDNAFAYVMYLNQSNQHPRENGRQQKYGYFPYTNT